jgi:hypothetical protein
MLYCLININKSFSHNFNATIKNINYILFAFMLAFYCYMLLNCEDKQLKH